MTRSGGNPDLVHHQLITDRDEPLIAKLSMRVSPSMLEQIRCRDNWQDFVRDAIAEKLKRQKLSDKDLSEGERE